MVNMLAALGRGLILLAATAVIGTFFVVAMVANGHHAYVMAGSGSSWAVWLIVAASVAAEAVAAICAFVIGRSLRRWAVVTALAAMVFWTLGTAWTVRSAVGTAGLLIGDTIEHRGRDRHLALSLQKEIEHHQGRLAWLSQMQLQEESQKSRGERAIKRATPLSVEYQRTADLLASARTQLSSIRSVASADPASIFLSWLTGYSQDAVEQHVTGWTIGLFAALLVVATNVGLIVLEALWLHVRKKSVPVPSGPAPTARREPELPLFSGRGGFRLNKNEFRAGAARNRGRRLWVSGARRVGASPRVVGAALKDKEKCASTERATTGAPTLTSPRVVGAALKDKEKCASTERATTGAPTLTSPRVVGAALKDKEKCASAERATTGAPALTSPRVVGAALKDKEKCASAERATTGASPRVIGAPKVSDAVEKSPAPLAGAAFASAGAPGGAACPVVSDADILSAILGAGDGAYLDREEFLVFCRSALHDAGVREHISGRRLMTVLSAAGAIDVKRPHRGPRLYSVIGPRLGGRGRRDTGSGHRSEREALQAPHGLL